MKCALGIDIGGTNTKLGLVTSNGELLKHDCMPTQSEDPFDIFTARIYKRCYKLLDDKSLQLIGVGVGAPNANSQTGRIEYPPNLQWSVEDLVLKFSTQFKLPIRLENDANIAAVGERVWGKCQNVEDFIVITIGTGLGTGISSSGKLITSYNGMAGEGGHLVVERGGRDCRCGGKGHLESYVSVGGVEQTYLELTDECKSFKEIKQLFKAQDKKAINAIEITADYLAFGLSQLQVLFLPRKFVLAGGVSSLGADFETIVKEKLYAYSYAPFRGQSQVELTELCLKHGSVLGAASLLF